MRAAELLEGIVDLDEGGASSGVRYNSELGTLLAFTEKPGADISNFNPETPELFFDAAKLENPDEVFREIKKFLIPSYDQKKFFGFYDLMSTSYIPKITGKLKDESSAFPAKFGWAGGANIGTEEEGPSDVTFIGLKNSGISIKDTGGITLANLTPKSLGLQSVVGEDIFFTYAPNEYKTWKMAAVTGLLKTAKGSPDNIISPIKEKYSIRYNSETNNYSIITGSKSLEMDEATLSNPSKMMKNAKWQRVFGDFLQSNRSTFSSNTVALYKAISLAFESIMEDYLHQENRITKLLQFGPKSYFYMTPKKLYYVPAFEELDELNIKGMKYNESDGTSLRFLTEIGRATEDDGAILDVYVRYANGIFAANPTVRIQSLKNPEKIYWEPL